MGFGLWSLIFVLCSLFWVVWFTQAPCRTVRMQLQQLREMLQTPALPTLTRAATHTKLRLFATSCKSSSPCRDRHQADHWGATHGMCSETHRRHTVGCWAHGNESTSEFGVKTAKKRRADFRTKVDFISGTWGAARVCHVLADSFPSGVCKGCGQLVGFETVQAYLLRSANSSWSYTSNLPINLAQCESNQATPVRAKSTGHFDIPA